jgi:single-strand DNA-binding protein
MSDLVTIVGSIVKEDPELRFTNSGTAVCEFGVRVPASKKNGTEAVIHNVVAWRELAENVAESVQKGDRVIVVGVPKTDEFVGRDGQPKRKDKITAYQVGVDLNYATATVDRVERSAPAEGQAVGYGDF